MVTKLFAGLMAMAAMTATGLALSSSGKSCCAPGSECCYAGSSCCIGDATVQPAADGPGQEAAKPVELPKAPAKAGCKCCAGDDAKAEKPSKADPKAITVGVDGMTCAGCAKTVTKAISAVEGVESVVIDLKAKTAIVTPKAGKLPSAKDLWEAVEKAEYKPTKLEGPGGTFVKKPTK
jgi:copper chaperone